MDSTTAQIRIRQAAPSDVDAVTAVLLAAMPGDRDWWDYRFPYRTQYPEDHRKFFRLLIETWVSPEFEDSVVMVAEAYDGAAGVWRMGAYAAWDVSYLSYRKYGAAYKPRKANDVLVAEGSATRRDADAARAVVHARAADEGQRKFLHPRYGTEQIHLQALGTHPSFTRRGLARELCRWGMDRAAGDSIVATLLAAPVARQVYARFGFEELGLVTVRVEGQGEGTCLTPMAWDVRDHR